MNIKSALKIYRRTVYSSHKKIQKHLIQKNSNLSSWLLPIFNLSFTALINMEKYLPIIIKKK